MTSKLYKKRANEVMLKLVDTCEETLLIKINTAKGMQHHQAPPRLITAINLLWQKQKHKRQMSKQSLSSN